MDYGRNQSEQDLFPKIKIKKNLGRFAEEKLKKKEVNEYL